MSKWSRSVDLEINVSEIKPHYHNVKGYVDIEVDLDYEDMTNILYRLLLRRDNRSRVSQQESDEYWHLAEKLLDFLDDYDLLDYFLDASRVDDELYDLIFEQADYQIDQKLEDIENYDNV